MLLKVNSSTIMGTDLKESGKMARSMEKGRNSTQKES